MADNIQLNPGVGGDVLAANDIGGIKHQRIKVQYGETGQATDVSSTDPLPTTIDIGTTKFLSDFTQSGNLDVVLSGAAQAGAHHEVTWVGWSFSGTPTTAPSLIISIGGTEVWNQFISDSGMDGITFNPPLYKETKTNNEDIVFTLEAGGAAITGKLQARYHYK